MTSTTVSITTVPLSTVFTAPASCSTSWTYEASTYNAIPSGILLQNAVGSFLDAECFPPGFEQAGRVFANQVFSPGACPEGYVTQSPVLVSAAVVPQHVVLPYEGSRDFTYTISSGYQGCISTYVGATSLAARAGGFSLPDTTSSTFIEGAYLMWGVPLTVEFQADQVSLYTTTTSSSSTSSLNSTLSSPPPSSIPSSTLPPTSSTPTAILTSPIFVSGGLSTGAKAGIAIATIAGALIIFGITALWWRQRRRSVNENQDSRGPVYEILGQHGGMGMGEHILYPIPRAELSGVCEPSEMPI